MLTMCDEHDGQTFVGGVLRPIGLGRMLCMSESHKSMQGLWIVDTIATEAGGGWMDESVMCC